MADSQFSALVSQLKTAGKMSEEQLLTLRRMTAADFSISADEADALFDLNDNLTAAPEAWREYFINAVATYLVSQTKPEGYVSDANAEWLIARITKNGVIETETEIALMMSVMKLAQNVSDKLERFALDLVKGAVKDGTGYWGKNLTLKPGVIGEAEVQMLRRVLYAVSSEGGVGISKMEAEALFDLNEACQSPDNHESWQRLFVYAIANHLMMLSAWEEPGAQEALRREKWLEDLSPTGLFSLGNIVRGIGKGFGGLGQKAAPGKSHIDNAASMASAEKVTLQEAQWLIARLNRDGGIDANERALLDFLKEECPDISKVLMPYVNAA